MIHAIYVRLVQHLRAVLARDNRSLQALKCDNILRREKVRYTGVKAAFKDQGELNELQLPRDPQAARAKFGDLRDLQREALAEMRSLIFELRPGSIERDGLSQALKTHVAAVESRVGRSIRLCAAREGRLPAETGETRYGALDRLRFHFSSVLKAAEGTEVEDG